MACSVETLLPNKPALAEIGDDVACRDAVIRLAACMALVPLLITRRCSINSMKSWLNSQKKPLSSGEGTSLKKYAMLNLIRQ